MEQTTDLPPPPMTLKEFKAHRKPLKNVRHEVNAQLKPLERFAMVITDHVGTMGFFLIIFCWTISWCGYNIISTEFPSLGMVAFDPFPAFVAYLLISNVIQILLMPLIMVGQNLQGRHSDGRAEHDLKINIKAEKEIEVVLSHLEYQQALMLKHQELLLKLVQESAAKA